MKLIIGADLVPMPSNHAQFAQGDVQTLLGDPLLQVLQQADFRIFNLEIPLTDQPDPIKKCGPALIAPTATAAGIRAMGVDLLAISNNHILDHGVSGLRSTMETLDAHGIAHIGAGNTAQEAAKPYIVEHGDKRIGIYACCEHEFSVVTEGRPGANPFDPLESPDHIAQLKAQCDYVIVLYHGGKEHYRYPSPMLQKICRKLVDKGADLVITQHSHCIGCREEYQGGTIVYGQGNFLFDHSESEFWKTSLLVQVNDDLSITYIPIVKAGNCVRLASEKQHRQILEQFWERSQEILQPEAIRERYDQFAVKAEQNYLNAISGKESIVFRVINKLLGNRLRVWRNRRRYNEKVRLMLRNYVECEAHRELMLRGLMLKK